MRERVILPPEIRIQFYTYINFKIFRKFLLLGENKNFNKIRVVPSILHFC